MSKFLNSILFLAAILAIGLVLSGYKENFDLMPSKIPSRLLLADTYPVKSNPGLSDNSSSIQYLLRPDEFAGDYKSVTNNKKNWDSPCDGTSFPPTICGGLYGKRPVKKEEVCQPGFSCRRVGFYCSSIN
jgi:hypothetical protein|tara:strand:- start:6105 stop:6494 length:390 start_codon:yes stop_codon:yes gene_type:complete